MKPAAASPALPSVDQNSGRHVLVANGGLLAHAAGSPRLTCAIGQLDRIPRMVAPWTCYLRAGLRSVFLRLRMRAHSGHSVWRTLNNGEGSVRPRRRAGSPHGLGDASPSATCA